MAKTKSACRDGGETRANGNCEVRAADDKLPVQCVGEWAKEKHHYLAKYIAATRQVRAKYITTAPGRSGGAAFVDLFSGPGRCRVRETGELISGSPLLALEHAEQPFSKVIMCDLDAENVGALRARVAGYGQRAVVIPGDCNIEVDEIVAQIPEHGLNIALLDPYGVGALDFRTIAKLAAFKRMDLIIHFPTMDMKRNFGRNQAKVDRFIGGGAPGAQPVTAAAVTHQLGVLRENLAAHGYTANSVRAMPVTNRTNSVLYHLAFVSKSDRGDAIWNSITITDARGQRSLPGM